MSVPTSDAEAPAMDRPALNAAVRQSLLLADTPEDRHGVYSRRPPKEGVPIVRAQGAILAMIAAASHHRNTERTTR